MFELFRKQDGVFDFMKKQGEEGSAFSRFMKGATFMIPTPRHIIKMMVEMVAPTVEDVICDPSAGSCGLLV